MSVLAENESGTANTNLDVEVGQVDGDLVLRGEHLLRLLRAHEARHAHHGVTV